MSYLIENITIVTQNKNREIINLGYLVIENGFITSVKRGAPSNNVIKGVQRIINGENLIVFPGFVNTHVHLGESIYENFISENFTLEEYLSYTNNLTKQISLFEEHRNLIANYTIINLLKYGNTTICGGRTRDASAVWHLRNVSGYMIMESNKLNKYLNNIEQQFAEENKKCKNDKNCLSAIFIHSLNKVSLNNLRVISRLLKLFPGLILMIHVAETTQQENEVIKKWKKSSIKVLEENKLLHKKTLLIHCNCVSESDISIIKKRNSSVVHCLSSNINVSDKIVNINNLIKHGIRICIATDGVVTSKTYSPLEEVKKILKKSEDKDLLTSQIALDAITTFPAEAINQHNLIGCIKEGKIADLVFFRKNTIKKYAKDLNLDDLLNSIKDVKVYGLIQKGLIEIWENKFCTFKEKKFLSKYNKLVHRIKEVINESDSY